MKVNRVPNRAVAPEATVLRNPRPNLPNQRSQTKVAKRAQNRKNHLKLNPNQKMHKHLPVQKVKETKNIQNGTVPPKNSSKSAGAAKMSDDLRPSGELIKKRYVDRIREAINKKRTEIPEINMTRNTAQILDHLRMINREIDPLTNTEINKEMTIAVIVVVVVIDSKIEEEMITRNVTIIIVMTIEMIIEEIIEVEDTEEMTIEIAVQEEIIQGKEIADLAADLSTTRMPNGENLTIIKTIENRNKKNRNRILPYLGN